MAKVRKLWQFHINPFTPIRLFYMTDNLSGIVNNGTNQASSILSINARHK
jgi:hypothetical protein